MVRPVHEIAMYRKVHIRYTVLITKKLQYPAPNYSRGARYHKIYYNSNYTLI